MANADSVNQDSNIQIPRKGEVMAKTVDTTGRAIDLRLLAFNDIAYRIERGEWVFINLKNESTTTSIYFYAAPDATVTISATDVLAAATAASFPTTHPWVLGPSEERSYRLARAVDLFLHVITAAGTATLRLGTSSDSTLRLY